ncbi:MAG: hypothetical protein WD004_03380 [Actinomycetota bacterium]
MMTDTTRAELFRAGRAAALGLIVGWVITRFARDAGGQGSPARTQETAGHGGVSVR